jgi:guanylate kinase
MRSEPLICISGKSGVGKTTLAGASGLSEVVSYTTRPQRDGEVDGVDYFFVDREYMLENREIFKHDWKEFNDNIYGATTEDLLSKDVLVITLDSAIELRKLGFNVYIIWLEGPVRSDRKRKDDVEKNSEMMKQVDDILINNEGIEDLAEKLIDIKGFLIKMELEKLKKKIRSNGKMK